MAKFPWQKKSQQAPAPQPPEQQSPEKAPEERNTVVEMHRSEEDAKGGPTVAEVHPSEVENWKAAGWKTK